jgi:hypothetical protein
MEKEKERNLKKWAREKGKWKLIKRDEFEKIDDENDVFIFFLKLI